MERAARYFAANGWQVQAGDSCFERQQRFAGPDELRAEELQRFCCDRSLDLVLAARGGYGLTRLLPRLNFAAMAEAGREVVGYSDFTAFNLAYLAQAGGISLHGPTATDFGADAPDAFMQQQFFAVLRRQGHELRFEADGPSCRVRGLLWGGNLAMVCALLGTPYLPKVRGGLLFLEDVNEPAYKIERMLLQLLQAGVLQKQRALLLGRFEPVAVMPNDQGYTLQSAIDFVRGQTAVPVVAGLPFGHVAPKATLRVGVRADMTVVDGQATLSWVD
jgi:muramoyltetrapeptide carboxypeptidase